MRASMGPVALAILVSISVAGCQSAPSMSSLAFWRKKDAASMSDAPKYNPAVASNAATPGSPALPSASQNPVNSLSNVQGSSYAANGATKVGISGPPVG